MSQQTIYLLIAGVFLTGIFASIIDYREQRIPNKLLMFSIAYFLVVFIYGFSQNDWQGFGKAFLRFPLFGMMLSGLVMFGPYRMRQVAAGDVKLAMVFGMFLGPIGGMLALVNGALFGGIWAIWISWRRGGLLKVFKNIKLMFGTAYVTGLQEIGWDLDSDNAITMPYGVALSFGAFSVASWQLWMQLAK